MSVAFVLSGGGARAAAQVGMLRALTEMAIEPGLIVGSSAGAVNGAWYGLFPGDLDYLEDVWLGLTRSGVFPGTAPQSGYNLMRHGHLYHIQAWSRVLERHYDGRTFEEAFVPLVAVTVRLRDGAVIAHDSGPITPVLRASTAVPGLFPPQLIEGELQVDGAVVEFLPILTAMRFGATEVFALDCSNYPEGEGSRTTAVDRAGQIAATAWVDLVVDEARARGIAVNRLRPPLANLHDGRDFRHTRRLMDTGYEYAKAVLQARTPTRV